MIKDEPQEYAKVFGGVFGGNAGFGDQARLEERYERERKAGRTLKQRARKPVRTKVINMRVEPAIKDLLAEMASRHDCSQADIIHEAVRMMAEAEGVLDKDETGE